MAYLDGSFILNPITDYAHLAGRGLMRHVLPAGNIYFLIIFVYVFFFMFMYFGWLGSVMINHSTAGLPDISGVLQKLRSPTCRIHPAHTALLHLA